MSKIEFQLNLFKGSEFLDIPNMQKNFLSESSAKTAIKHSKVLLQKHGATHFEIIEHRESFNSKGKFTI